MSLQMNDGSQNPPRIEIHQAMWGMSGLGENGRFWTLEEQLDKIAEAGFTGITGAPPTEEARKRVERYGLKYGGGGFPWTAGDLEPMLRRAKDNGSMYFNSQVLDNFVIGEEAIRRLAEMTELAARIGMPHFVETHRGRITQDIIRTADYVQAIADLRLTIDFSHYVVNTELDGFVPQTAETAEGYFQLLLQRTSSIHARVSNGHQVQADIGPEGTESQAERFYKWWETGMRNWLQQAGPGDILPFIVELGPPPYALTRTVNAYNDTEITDRWQQALAIKKRVETIVDRLMAERQTNGE
ncbi:sugar phosphate isomerase/epimerase family protein [Paenibacillus cymbidii]|uniref:sugar phosphate isomerase/epimerase family protein n=1 Tax=Paenibacillus cymbidii TaxID=1639034 RepID=UPI0010807AD5|nr:sugar phosphate isomerase/epimerase [Paenibacillus cymbidii]